MTTTYTFVIETIAAELGLSPRQVAATLELRTGSLAAASGVGYNESEHTCMEVSQWR